MPAEAGNGVGVEVVEDELILGCLAGLAEVDSVRGVGDGDRLSDICNLQRGLLVDVNVQCSMWHRLIPRSKQRCKVPRCKVSMIRVETRRVPY